MNKTITLACAALIFAPFARGGDFQQGIQGVRQTAMGSSGVAWSWDAATVYYNPAGVSRLQDLQVYATAGRLAPGIRYTQWPTGEYQIHAQQHTAIPFAAYVAGPVKQGSRFGIGMGIYTPFSKHLDWGDDWVGRYLVQSISFSSHFIQPTVSYRVTDMVSAGVGFVYATGTMAFSRAIPLQDAEGNDGQAQLTGKAQGIGLNAGVQVEVSDKFRLGVAYRSGVRMKVEHGDADFTVALSLAERFPSTSFSTELPLPGFLAIGAGYRVNRHITLQGDVILARWKSHDVLNIDFQNNTAAVHDVQSLRAYKNTVSFHLGAHYQVTPAWSVMLGGAYEPTPVRGHLLSPDGVDADKVSVACGVGFRPWSQFSIAAALRYITTEEREAGYEPAGFYGMYQVSSLMPAIGASYNF